jgi:raffinose/stachyose/melibiose transport system permease protein
MRNTVIAGRTTFREETGKYLTYILLILISILIIGPLLYIGVMSISDPKLSTDHLFSFIKHPRFIENYSYALERGRILRYFANTVFVVIFTVAMVIVAAAFSGFAFRINKNRKIQIFYFIFLLGLFIPVQAVIIPLFRILKTVNLLNTLWALMLVYAATMLPLNMMLFTGYYKSIPKELDESSIIDGCRPVQTLFNIILPLATPILITSVVLTSLRVWRDFFVPLVIITSPMKNTISIGLLAFVDEFSIEWNSMCAAMVMQMIPIIILFLLLQKYFISGVTKGALKG